jgi:hypothetical protein
MKRSTIKTLIASATGIVISKIVVTILVFDGVDKSLPFFLVHEFWIPLLSGFGASCIVWFLILPL